MVKLTCLASCTAVGLLPFVTEPAFAEFQIQEAGSRKSRSSFELAPRYTHQHVRHSVGPWTDPPTQFFGT
jgi:hypothetical protein